ncbi:MAG: biotin transporter BioY [Candidatus Oleimicrobiaceae bacterium]
MDRRSSAQYIALCSLIAALTAVGAYVRVPTWPVPFTLQTLFVLLGGDLLPVGYAVAAQVVYVAGGLAGLPLFAGGSGLGAIFHPTFGYLVAFPVASAAASLIVRRGRPSGGPEPSWERLVAANGCAALLVLLVGATYLYFNLRLVAAKAISPRTALWSGAVLFVPGEALKITVVSAVVRKVWSALQR